MSRLQN